MTTSQLHHLHQLLGDFADYLSELPDADADIRLCHQLQLAVRSRIVTETADLIRTQQKDN